MICRIQQPPDLHLPNLDGLGLQGPVDDESQQYIDPEKKLLDDNATWEFIRWARQFWSKPIVVKVCQPLQSLPALVVSLLISELMAGLKDFADTAAA